MSVNREGDREARFLATVADVYEPLQRYLGRRMSGDDAPEVLNDVLLVLWRRLDDLPTDDALAWSYGVAKRCLANHRRSVARRDRLRHRVTRQARTDVAAVSSWSTATEGALASAVARLDEPDREVLRLWAWERLEPREIAIVLDTTPNAVSVRLSRAKQRLAAAMRRQDPGPAGQKVVGHGKEIGA